MSDSKKVAIIGTVGLPACYHGFENLTAYLVKYLHEQHELTGYCSGKTYAKAVRRLHSYFNGKLKLDLHPETTEEMQVSRDKADAFKAWLRGELAPRP